MLFKINSDLYQQLIAFLPTLANVFLCQSHLFWLMNATFYLMQPGNGGPSATLGECALLGLSLETGKLLFSWPGGMLLDKYGSKKMTLIIGLVNSVSWMMLVFSNSLGLVYIIRILSGSALALNFCNYTSITGELSSPEFRGVFSSIVLLVGRFAAVFQSTISVIFGSYKSLAVTPAILSLIFLPMSRFSVESPYFLVNEGKLEKARRCLEKLHPTAGASQIQEKLQRINQLMASQKKADADSLWKIFTKGSNRKTVLRVCLVNGFVQLSGAQIFTYYVTILLPQNRFVSNASYPLIISLTTIAAQLFWTAKIENFPRRILFLITCPLSGLLWVSMGTIYRYDLQERAFWKSIVYVDAIVIMAIMGALLLPLVDIISAELFPFNIKGKANACVFLARSIFAIVTLILFDIIAENLGIYASFYFYASALFVLAIIVYFVLPETRGRSLIDLHFDNDEVESDLCSENSKLDPESFRKYDGIVSNGKLPAEN